MRETRDLLTDEQKAAVDTAAENDKHWSNKPDHFWMFHWYIWCPVVLVLIIAGVIH